MGIASRPAERIEEEIKCSLEGGFSLIFLMRYDALDG